jgi:hypothetical protein
LLLPSGEQAVAAIELHPLILGGVKAELASAAPCSHALLPSKTCSLQVHGLLSLRAHAQVMVDGIKHIILFAKRPLSKGEEIMYDYKLPVEDIKIICHCGASNCRGYMN